MIHMKYSGIMGQLQGKDQLPVTIGDRHTCITNNSIWAVHEGYTKVGANFNTLVPKSYKLIYIYIYYIYIHKILDSV